LIWQRVCPIFSLYGPRETPRTQMRHASRHLFRPAVVLCSLLLITACETDGPEFADGETTSFIEGTLELGQISDTHVRALTKAGTVSLQLSEVVARDAESGNPLENYIFGVSVGLPNSEDETICQITFSKFLSEEQSFSVYAREGLFCVVTFRPPDQPQETIVRYLITLSGAFS
jgi:hypothetical protein